MARGKLQGFVEKGGNTVNTDGRVSTTQVQRSFPLATVEVFNGGTAVQATIFSDEAGTPKSNPFVADTSGFWFFWADQGRYDVQFSGAGLSVPFTLFGLETIITTTALNDPGANGVVVRTSSGVTTVRTITGTASAIVITNGDGVSGNPVINLDTNLAFSGKTITGGAFVSPGITSFQNAQHLHFDAGSGGQLNASNVFSTGTVPVARLPLMVGATSVLAGVAGLVTQPIAGDQDKFLRGDGTWQVTGGGGGIPGSPSLSLQYNNAGAFAGVTGTSSDGTQVTWTDGVLRATSPRITTSIKDANGNAIIGLGALGSAVNNIQFNNAATGGNVVIAAVGSDPNITLNIDAKGSGELVTTSNFKVSNNAPQITLVDVNDSKTVRMSVSGSNWDFTNDTLGSVPIRIDTTTNAVTFVGNLSISNTAPKLQFIDTNNTKTMEIALDNTAWNFNNSTLATTPLSMNTGTDVFTFLQIPVGPASNPTTDNQLARKKYIDDKVVYFSLAFRIDDPSTFPLNDDSALPLVRVPVITGGFVTKITIIRAAGSHTSGGSVTFQARIFNSTTIGSGVSFNNTNNLASTPYTEDFADVAISEGNFLTVLVTARSGTVDERAVSINIEGFRKVT